jgi:hypothetical protein
MSKYGRAVLFRLSDQQPPEKLCDGSMTGQLAESLFKRRKFLYIEMQDCNRIVRLRGRPRV